MKHIIMDVENNDVVERLRLFLGQLLENKIVDALLVPKKLPGGGFVQSLIRDPAMLKDTNPLAPTMAVQSSEILKKFTASTFKGRLGVVLKPCEMRAVIELVKFLQIKLDNVITIGVDCKGTVELEKFASMSEDERKASSERILFGIKGKDNDTVDATLRDVCRVCEYPAPMGADISIGLFGQDVSKKIVLFVGERVEKELTEKLTLDLKDGVPTGRENATNKIVDNGKKEREKMIGEFKEQVSSLDKMLETFATCIRCYNCMNVCPICYCKECVFHSHVFEHKSDQLLKLADRKGAIRMPTDTLMFHLTRLGHMATSCIGCGMCESACPNHLPVAKLFNLIGKELQNMFDYVPGKDAEEDPPVSVFKEEELEAESGTR